MSEHEVSVEEEIADTSNGCPHVLLLGAGASRAALPNGDKHGKPVPLLREVANELKLFSLFPKELQSLAKTDFEAAYSDLHTRGDQDKLEEIDCLVRQYFSELELPDKPNLYDIMLLSMRDKDAIFTFNWDPFLIQARLRLSRHGLDKSLPMLFFLHGNVMAGYCEKDKVSGPIGFSCSRCKQPFVGTQLLFPVKKKDYQSSALIKRDWEAAEHYLEGCTMLTVFGYSAPTTDKEAIELLKKGWGDVEDRDMEQTEVINRPGSDRDKLRKTWDPFIHTHHYDVLYSFYDSFLAKHPRRSIEAHWNQYYEAKFIENNTVPNDFKSFDELATWFKPLFEAEKK